MPQNPTPQQSSMLTNPFPQQGFVSAQPQPGQAAHPTQPSSPFDYHILKVNSNEVNPSNINLQTRLCQYDKTSNLSATESKTKVSVEPLMAPNGLLQIPQPKFEAIPKIPKGTLCHNAVSNRVCHTYSIVENLAQSLASMSMLEVLPSCPSQKKALLTTLGAVDPSDDRLIVFSVDSSEHPPLPSPIAFEIPIRVCNAIISLCIIDEGASTYVMSAIIWKQLKSSNLFASTFTLCV